MSLKLWLNGKWGAASVALFYSYWAKNKWPLSNCKRWLVMYKEYFSTTRSRCCPFTDLQDLNCIFMGGGTWAEHAGTKLLKTHSCSHVQLSRVTSEKVQAWSACVKTAKFIMNLDRLWCKLQPDWLVKTATLETSKTEWNYLWQRPLFIFLLCICFFFSFFLLLHIHEIVWLSWVLWVLSWSRKV